MQESMNIEKPAEATTCWVQLYSDSLYSWALHKTSDKETAEDLVQETFLVAVKSFNKFKGDSNPKTWLFAILNNKINDHYRKSYRTPIINNETILDRFFDDEDHWKKDKHRCNGLVMMKIFWMMLNFNNNYTFVSKDYPPIGIRQFS